MKPLIIGEAPGKSKDQIASLAPLSGAVGVRLCQLAGIDPDPDHYCALGREYDLTNLLSYWPGQSKNKSGAYSRGASFPVDEAVAAKRERVGEFDGKTIVLLGHRLMRVFRIHPRPFYEWNGWRSSCVVGIPHPSGLTRNYNDPEQRRLAGDALRQAIERASKHAAR